MSLQELSNYYLTKKTNQIINENQDNNNQTGNTDNNNNNINNHMESHNNNNNDNKESGDNHKAELNKLNTNAASLWFHIACYNVSQFYL